MFATSVWKTLITIANGWTPVWVEGTTGKLTFLDLWALSLLSTWSKTCSINSSVFMHYFQVLLLGTVLSYNRRLSAYCGCVVRIYSALPQSVQLTDCTAVCRWVTCSIILPSRWKLQHWKLSFVPSFQRCVGEWYLADVFAVSSHKDEFSWSPNTSLRNSHAEHHLPTAAKPSAGLSPLPL